MGAADSDARREWMGLLARNGAGAAAALQDAGLSPEHTLLRVPEIGSVMVRGRAGATGDRFNLGEMTVTRCSVQLTTGEVGHGYVQGRDKEGARAAALVDALLQSPDAAGIEARVLGPLRAEEYRRRAERGRKAAATRVNFFTMTRGENA